MSEETFGVVSLIGSLVIVAGVFAILVHSIGAGSLQRNALFGIRIPSTLASDEAWEAGHRAALPAVRVTIVVCLVMAALAAAVLAFSATAALTLGFVGLALMLAALLVATWQAHRAARAT